MRKYTALTNIPKKQLYELFNFTPVMIASPIYIEVAEFLSEMKDKYKLIHWEFEALGGGQYFIVTEVDEK